MALPPKYPDFPIPGKRDEVGLDYYGARYYDPKTSVWLGVDPKSDKYPGWSPYNYCMQNPIKFIDPNGMDGDVEIEGSKVTIKVQIYIYGSGANTAQAQKMQKNFTKDWNTGFSYLDGETGEQYSVNFDVSVQVYDKNNPQNGPGLFSNKNNPFSTDNFIEIGANSKDVSRSNVTGGDEGKWRGYGTDPSSHEFGHLIGLRDHYSDAYGTEKGWEGNVMGEAAGYGVVQQNNINALMTPIINGYKNSDQYQVNRLQGPIHWNSGTTIDRRNLTW